MWLVGQAWQTAWAATAGHPEPVRLERADRAAATAELACTIIAEEAEQAGRERAFTEGAGQLSL